MNLLPSAEQDELARIVDRLCRNDDPATRIAGVRTVGLFDAEGLAADDEVVAYRVLGRHLAPLSWLVTALAASWRPSGTVALAEPHGPGAWRLVGDRHDDLVLAVGPDETRLLHRFEAIREARPGFDPGTDIVVVPDATVAGADVVGRAPSGPVRRRGSLLVAALLAGSAEASLERSVAHAKEREQFGRPIGAFQAVAHRCADMAMRAEAAVAAVHLAAATAAAPAEETEAAEAAEAALAAARLVAADAALRNAAEDIQHHGALGFTAEMDCHRHLKRAHLLERTFGGPEDQVDALLTGGSAARTRPG